MEIVLSIVTVIAVLVAPFLAVQANEIINARKEARNRKMQIFRDLMETRATALSPKHVQALNRIDIEFYGVDKKTKAVSDSWKEYHDHLSVARTIEVDNREKWENWNQKKEDLIANLLLKMSECLGYNFDVVHIKRGHYYPKAYVDIETELAIIRRGLVEIFLNKRFFPIMAWVAQAAQPDQPEMD